MDCPGILNNMRSRHLGVIAVKNFLTFYTKMLLGMSGLS